MKHPSSSADLALAPLLTPIEVAELLRQAAGAPAWPNSPVPPMQGRVGERSARRTGSGMDYAETRPYQGGDDPRYLNWRATARSGSLQVRRFHQDMQPAICCVVDRGPSMRFGTRRRLKATQAGRLALLLAAQEMRCGGELAALVLEDAGRYWSPPAVGVAALQRLARQVVAPAPAPASTSRQADGWSQTCAELVQRLAPGSRILLISDFRGLTQVDRDLLAGLGRRFDARALVVYDDSEQELPAVGPLLLCWGEAVRNVDGRDAVQRRRHADAWQAYRTGLHDLFMNAGIPWRLVPAAADDIRAVLRGAPDGH